MCQVAAKLVEHVLEDAKYSFVGGWSENPDTNLVAFIQETVTDLADTDLDSYYLRDYNLYEYKVQFQNAISAALCKQSLLSLVSFC